MPFPRPGLVTHMVVDTSIAVRRTTFYWEVDVPPTGLTDLEAICDAVMTNIGVEFATFLTTQSRVLRFEGRWYGAGTTGFEANSTLPSIQGSYAAATPGSGSDEVDGLPDTLPDEVSLIIQKRTGNTGRAQMGRWFFTGLSEQIQNHGRIDAGALAAIKNFANNLSGDVPVSGGFTTVCHARHWNRKDNTLMPITKCYAISTMGTRLDRRRPLALERA